VRVALREKKKKNKKSLANVKARKVEGVRESERGG
jgi:hypothetical protein